jgi:hypothetical protein
MSSTASTEHDPMSAFPGGRAAVFRAAAAAAAAWAKRAPQPTGRKPKRLLMLNTRGGQVVSTRVFQRKAPWPSAGCVVGARRG